MPLCKVAYKQLYVVCTANDEEDAKRKSLDLFPIKYPRLIELDTDKLKVETLESNEEE